MFSMIFVKPRTKHLCAYYIDSLKDERGLDYDEMYQFLCKYAKPELTNRIFHLLSTKQEFILDIENQELAIVSLDVDEEQSNLRNFRPGYSEIEKQVMDEMTVGQDKNQYRIDLLQREVLKI